MNFQEDDLVKAVDDAASAKASGVVNASALSLYSRAKALVDVRRQIEELEAVEDLYANAIVEDLVVDVEEPCDLQTAVGDLQISLKIAERRVWDSQVLEGLCATSTPPAVTTRFSVDRKAYDALSPVQQLELAPALTLKAAKPKLTIKEIKVVR